MGSDQYPIIKQWTAEDEKRLSQMARQMFRWQKSQKLKIEPQRQLEAAPIG